MRTVLAGIAVAVMTILMSCIAVLARVLRLSRAWPQWCMRTWARGVCVASGTRVVLHGAEHLPGARGAIYASNHVSWFDVFSLASSLPRYTFVAKAELRAIPIFGWGAEASGVVFLSREDRSSAFATYQDVAAQVAAGLSVIVFPEGTRGDDYRLRPFKKGPFVLAIAAKAPIVPVVIHGTREVMPRGTWRVRAHTVHVHLLAPVDSSAYDYETRHELMRAVWQRMADCLRDRYGAVSDEPSLAPGTVERSA